MAFCACGNPIGAASTSCPRCGRTFIGRTILVVGGFFGFIILVLVILAS